MPSYTARIELHDAKEEDYNKLHGFMYAEGFDRTIQSVNDSTFQLPPAEYVARDVDLTIQEALEKAKTAAAKTKKKYEALVSEAVRWTWYNLRKVER